MQKTKLYGTLSGNIAFLSKKIRQTNRVVFAKFRAMRLQVAKQQQNYKRVFLLSFTPFFCIFPV